MIKLTVRDLLNAIPSLEVVSKLKLTDSITAFRLAKILRLLNQELEVFNSARDTLLKSYESDSDEFIVEFEKLLNEELVLQVNLLDVTAFSNLETPLKVVDFMRLSFMFNEELD